MTTQGQCVKYNFLAPLKAVFIFNFFEVDNGGMRYLLCYYIENDLSTKVRGRRSQMFEDVRRCSSKWMLLKTSQISQEKKLCWSLFLIKLQARSATLLKIDCSIGVFL